jgi:hypothetical protein
MTNAVNAASFDMSFEQRLARVDLSKIMAEVTEEHGLSAETALRAEDLYRKYLTLIARYPGQDFTPSRLIDLVWHAHITSTRQYMADCDLLFGEYLHHTMIEDQTERLEASREGTTDQFQAMFGIPMNYGLVPEYALMAGCAGNCENQPISKR